MDILQTLSGVIADIILGSDRNKGTSNLVLSFEKEQINGEEKQILTIEIFGEKASTVYPLPIPPQVFQYELIGAIQSAENRDNLVENIYTILFENLGNVLDPTGLNAPKHEGPIGNTKTNVRIFAIWYLPMKYIFNNYMPFTLSNIYI